MPASARTLAAAIGLLLLTAPAASAQYRSPQVPVSGTALASFFASQGQAINVNTDQLELQSASVPVNTSVVMRGFFVGGPGSSFGLYNGAPASPPLYLVFPGAASSGWFASASYRTAPTRLVVNLFDNNSAFVGATTYLAGPPDPSDVGFYIPDGGSGATLYSQDARNTGGAARILMYAGTGAHAGETWFAGETGSGPGGDFADIIALVQIPLAPTDVMHASWGALKHRFR
jgi:hypothetical protein